MVAGFLVPVNANDPPPLAIAKQLNAVYSAHERFWIIQIVPRFVGAPDVGHLFELFRYARDFLFIKPTFLKERLDSRDEPFDVE